MGKLTAAQVKHAKQGRHGDGRGLYLQVIGGSKTWLLRYKHQRRERWMGLGSVEFVTLAQAREQAFELRRKLKHEKIDPLEARRRLQVGARLAALTGTHLRTGCPAVCRGPGDGEEVARRRLAPRVAHHVGAHAFPKIGSLPVDLIDSACVRSVLDPVWIEAKKPHVGARLRERLEIDLGVREGERAPPGRQSREVARRPRTQLRRDRDQHRATLPRCPSPRCRR